MKCILIGAGGHGRVLIEAFSPAVFEGIIDAQSEFAEVLGVPVLGGDELLPSLSAQGLTHFVIGVGSSKSCERREYLYQLALSVGLVPQEVIQSTAWISKSVTFSEGCQILTRALVNTGAKLDENVLVNSSAIIEHDCIVGAHSHIATGAVLCGGVRVGRAVHVGAGAVIRQGVQLGDRSVIGAGAVVVHDVLPGQRVVGVPARPLLEGGQC